MNTFTLLVLDSGKQDLENSKTQMKCHMRRYSSGSAMFAKITTLFRDRNILNVSEKLPVNHIHLTLVNI